MEVESSLRDCKIGETCYKVKLEDEINNEYIDGFFSVMANEDNASIRYVVKLKNSSSKFKSITASLITETMATPNKVVEHVSGSTVTHLGSVASGSLGTHPSNFDIVLWKTRPAAILSGTVVTPITIPIPGLENGETCESLEINHFTIKKVISLN